MKPSDKPLLRRNAEKMLRGNIMSSVDEYVVEAFRIVHNWRTTAHIVDGLIVEGNEILTARPPSSTDFSIERVAPYA